MCVCVCVWDETDGEEVGRGIDSFLPFAKVHSSHDECRVTWRKKKNRKSVVEAKECCSTFLDTVGGERAQYLTKEERNRSAVSLGGLA